MKVLKIQWISVNSGSITGADELMIEDELRARIEEVTTAILRQADIECEYRAVELEDRADLQRVNFPDSPGLKVLSDAGWPMCDPNCVNVYLVNEMGPYGTGWIWPYSVACVSRKVINLYGTGRSRLCTFAHEIVHTLGLRHADPKKVGTGGLNQYIRWLMAPGRVATTSAGQVYPKSIGNARLQLEEITVIRAHGLVRDVHVEEIVDTSPELQGPEPINQEPPVPPPRKKRPRLEEPEEPIQLTLRPGVYVITVEADSQ